MIKIKKHRNENEIIWLARQINQSLINRCIHCRSSNARVFRDKEIYLFLKLMISTQVCFEIEF